MSEISLSQALSQAFEDRVDLGSWARFTPSLAQFLDQVRTPVSRPTTQRAEAPESVAEPLMAPSGGTLLLIAPAPIVKAEESPWEGQWSRLRSRLRRTAPPRPSPDRPSVVLTGCDEGIKVSLPELDAQGRVLLGATERGLLDRIGWRETGHALTRVLPNGDEAAEMVTRILIEVLEVAHLADLGYFLHAHSDTNRVN